MLCAMPKRKTAKKPQSGDSSGRGRNVIPIALDAETNELLDKLVERSGGTKSRIINRILTWAATQKSWVQLIVIGWKPESYREDLARVLVHMAGELRSTDDPGKTKHTLTLHDENED